MKCFVALFAVILAISAMPSDISNDAVFGNDGFVPIINPEPVVIGEANLLMANEPNPFNGTRSGRNTGLAGWGAGTIGGAGGAVWTVWDAWALRDAIRPNDRRIVYVRGRIDLLVLFNGSPGIALLIGNNKSIIGGDSNAMIFGGGLRASGSENIIIQNLRIHNAISFAPGEQHNGNGGIVSQVPGAWSTIDALGIDRSRYVWVDHCEFSDDPFNAYSIPENRRRHDGLLDITQGADAVSVSNCIFRNHDLVGLVGNDDNNGAMDTPTLRVTYYLNWFSGTVQRHPRVRYGRVHVLNNLYTDIRSYGIGVGAGARIYVERNCFINTRRAWGFAAGTPNPMGNLAQLNNLLVNSGFDSGIPSNANFIPSQHYGYTPMAAASVEAHVRRFAGPR